MLMPGRTFAGGEEYRYGFNNQEKDDEVKGNANSVNFNYRMYDPRIARFFAVDPLSPKYPMLTPYQFASNNPIWMREIEGLEGQPTTVLESPVGDAPVTSEYGADRSDCDVCSDTHAGTDFGVASGTSVQSTAPGTVVRSAYSSSYGNVVIVDHGVQNGGTDHVYTLYAHLSNRTLSVGDNVPTGGEVGKSGSTGHSTGPHLHYEVIVSDPEEALTSSFYSDDRTRNRSELPVLLNGTESIVEECVENNASAVAQGTSAQSEVVKDAEGDSSDGFLSSLKSTWNTVVFEIEKKVKGISILPGW
jgi:RHS repeat-associated protein